MKRVTYIAQKSPGRRGPFRVVRSAWSMQRAAWRAVERVPVRKVWVNGAIVEQPITGTAQDHQDLLREKYLSRSKPYTNPGVREAARRARRWQATLASMPT